MPCCILSLVSRLAFVSVWFAACASPGLTTYSDTDPPIENGGSGGGSCSANAFTVTAVTPFIQLVVDGSGSMGGGVGGNSYQTLRDSLTATTTGVLNPLQSKARFGVSIYTSDNPCPKLYTQPCVLGNMMAIRNEFNQTGPQVTDPLDQSIDAVAATLGTAPAGSKKVIVIATDGVPNDCNSNTDDHTTQAVTAATNAYNSFGITTYVIGLGNGGGGGGWTNFLQKIANAGTNNTTATPSPYWDANNPTDVTNDYNAIFNTVLDCELTLNGTIDVAQASLGTVRSNGTMLTYSTDWTAVDEHTIKLLGNVCTMYNAATPPPEITATFTCGSSH
jgi:von Willebrand factor type A domain